MEEELQDRGSDFFGKEKVKRASRLFNQEELLAIASAVVEAEGETAGEIVPVVATSSGRYDRAEDIFGVVFVLAALTLAWIFFQDLRPVGGDWESGQALVLGLVPILLIVIVGFLLGTTAATMIPVLRLPFISRKEMREEVERCAGEAFHRFKVRKTAGSSGILIFVSLYEHMVQVIGDEGISQKLSQSDWEAVRDLIIDGIRSRKPAHGLTRAIKKCGEMLKEHFPIQPGDTDELHNELRIID